MPARNKVFDLRSSTRLHLIVEFLEALTYLPGMSQTHTAKGLRSSLTGLKLAP